MLWQCLGNTRRREMKAVQLFAKAVVFGFMLLLPVGSHAANTNTNTTTIVGQWDFDSGDLRATTGQPLAYLNGVITSNATVFTTFLIDDSTANAMGFPAAHADQGYIVTNTAPANGGGTNVNQYTLIMDLMYPEESDLTWRAILQTGNNEPGDDAELFVNPLGGIGTGANYFGEIITNIWTRVAFTVDITNDNLSIYTNWTLAGSASLSTTIDGPWSLGPTFLLFTDDSDDTAAGYVNSIQYRSGVMTADEIAALGGPSAGGISASVSTNSFKMTITKSGSNVHITADTPGTYQLETTPTLVPASWQSVVGTQPSSGPWDVPIAPGTKTAFFRLKR